MSVNPLVPGFILARHAAGEDTGRLYDATLFAAGRGRAEAVLEILRLRGLSVTEEQRERILGCKDLAVLGRWLARAVTAAATDEVFSAS